eukprot:CAMPEP_0172590724 /NCGR_PEP_ID=MMETSP1068-20121228/9355_1 /TAXON_ID=35684 /ORGANISM="Pseudopedinella elastica, Strain CCMP716" /LENGTH=68 /DNA_ID=CAMNT_0013386787 /DNA_START=1145 /DNA_END=1351 /DNA_ORIENTATION=+
MPRRTTSNKGEPGGAAKNEVWMPKSKVRSSGNSDGRGRSEAKKCAGRSVVLDTFELVGMIASSGRANV